MIPVPYDQDTDPTRDAWGWVVARVFVWLVVPALTAGLLVLAGMAVFGALWLTTGWTP